MKAPRFRGPLKQPDLAPVTHVCRGCGVTFSSPYEARTLCGSCERQHPFGSADEVDVRDSFIR